MIRLPYSEIKKDLGDLYAEHQAVGFTVDQHIGRCRYEYELITDPEENREIETFFLLSNFEAAYCIEG